MGLTSKCFPFILQIISAITGGITDLSFNATGYAWQTLNCFLTASYSVSILFFDFKLCWHNMLPSLIPLSLPFYYCLDAFLMKFQHNTVGCNFIKILFCLQCCFITSNSWLVHDLRVEASIFDNLILILCHCTWHKFNNVIILLKSINFFYGIVMFITSYVLLFQPSYFWLSQVWSEHMP